MLCKEYKTDQIKQTLITVFNGKETNMQFNLQSYTPEAPKESTNEPFKYEGRVNVLEAEIKINEKASEYYGVGIGSKYLSFCLEVPEDADEHAKRRVYKKFQIESEMKDSKGKTPAHKLADWVKEAGLVVVTEDDVPRICQRLLSEPVYAKLWAISIKDKKTNEVDNIQMSKLIEAPEVAGGFAY